MPSTVADIFAAAGATPAGVVRWGKRPARPMSQDTATGIYVVSLTDRLDTTEDAVEKAPISPSAVQELLDARPELRMDGSRPTREQLAGRVAAFWFPDEVVVYIGLAGPRASRPREGEVATRVGEYYKTPLGARAPHAGGWPLKTLACLRQLYVHYAYCDRVSDAEDACIGHFAEHVSETTRSRLHDPVRVMPFANLEFPKGNSKNHGIRGARAPKKPKPSAVPAPTRKAPATAPAPPSVVKPAPARPASSVTPHHRSQNVTAKDIEVGQVRIPVGATKTVLPAGPQYITVVVRGRELSCRWDPRYGEKERSGVIRVGKAAAVDLLAPGDVLTVAVDAAGRVTLD